MDKFSYTDAVRIFSNYFTSHVTDFMSLNSKTFSNGFFKRSSSSTDNMQKNAHSLISSKIGFETELDIKKFFKFSFLMFIDYSKNEKNFNDLHLIKENNSIFKFLKSLIDFKGSIKDCDLLTPIQIK